MTERGVNTAAREVTALVVAAQAGDEAALTELISAHLSLIYNIIGRALNGHADADDLVQETMIQAIRHLPGLRDPERFRSWLVTIAYRQVQMRQRSLKRLLLRRQEVPSDLPDPCGDFAERTVTELMLTGQRRELAEAARWLDDDDRRLLGLWWQEATGELSRAEVAAALAVSPKHAGVRLQRMKAQLEAARAVVRALHASPRCPELSSLTRDWDGRAEPVWRKRLTRHVRDCRHCQRHRTGLVAPEKLLLGLAPVPVAAGLAVGTHTAGGSAPIWTALQNLLSKKVAAVTAMAAVATGGGFAYTVYHSPISPEQQMAVRPTSTVATPPAGAAATGGTPSGPTPSASPARQPAGGFGLIGWAAYDGGTGGRTSGGTGGQTVTVTTLDDLTAQAKSSSTLIIRVNGNFTCSDDVRIAGNKTILGVGVGAGLTGCGLNLRNTSNVIVRNMNIARVKSGNGNGDAVHIDNSTRIWIDHNDLSSDTTHDNDYYDGLLDISHGADYITVSWNAFHDHARCSLVGHSDNNAEEDVGHLRVTFHHNMFSDCAQQNPRVRFGNPVHVFNNYYTVSTAVDESYGIATTCDGGVLLEGNVFEHIAEPTHLGEGSSPAGNLVSRDNALIDSGAIQTRGKVASIPYGYTADPGDTVKSMVISGAGTGKIAT
ncbi:MAG: sigma-70 family RNA polymerase sigma factor [Micromonosporaceae bacterium]|nr:sigma-70 family RNA polymerase sigma factor [Micromonosporaceae bacterium]